jgi:hypothetical protein
MILLIGMAGLSLIQSYFNISLGLCQFINYILQYGCGVIGVFALFLWLSIWLNQAKSCHRIETLAPRWRALTIIGIALCAFV